MTLDRLKAQMVPILSKHDSIGLYLSGGSDSLLLLRLMLDLEVDFSVVTFDHSFSREQRQVIDDLADRFNIRIFSYPPSSMYLIGDGKQKVTLVEEYMLLDGLPLPFLRDCQQDDSQCVYDTNLKGNLVRTAPLGFSLSIFGTRRYDWHYSLGKLLPVKEWKRGILSFYAPLYHMTRAEVAQALTDYGESVPKLDTGMIPLCTKCLTANGEVECPKTGKMVAPFDWNPNEMRDSFQNKYDRRSVSARKRELVGE